MSDYLENRRYSPRHLWVEPDETGQCAYVGVTDYLADGLGPIDGLDLPLPGDDLDAGEPAIHLHVDNRIHHLRAILGGTVLEVNTEVQDNPDLLHVDPDGNWLLKIEYDDPDELEMLMDAEKYARYLDGL